MATSNVTQADWDRLYPLPDGQVEAFVQLQESAFNVHEILGLSLDTQAGGETAQQGTNHVDGPAWTVDELRASLADLAASKVGPVQLLDVDPFIQHLTTLQSNVTACHELETKLDAASSLVGSLRTHHAHLVDRSAPVRQAADRLVREKQAAATVAREIESHLAKFAFLDEFSAYVATATPTDAQFATMLDRADDCMQFLVAHPHFTDAALFHERFLQCMRTTLHAARDWIIAQIEAAAPAARDDAHAAAAAGVSDVESPVVAEVLLSDASVALLTAAHTAPGASRVRDTCVAVAPALSAIEARCRHYPEFDVVRRECVQAHVNARAAVGEVVVTALVEQLDAAARAGVNIVTVLSVALSSLFAMIEEEQGLASILLSPSYQTEIHPLVIILAAPLAAFFKPALASEHDLASLSDVCRLLLKPRGDDEFVDTPASLTPLAALLRDAQLQITQAAHVQLHQALSRARDFDADVSSVVASLTAILDAVHGVIPHKTFKYLVHEAVPAAVARIAVAAPSARMRAPSVDAARGGALTIDTALARGEEAPLQANAYEASLFQVGLLVELRTHLRAWPEVADLKPAVSDVSTGSTTAGLLGSLWSLGRGSEMDDDPSDLAVVEAEVDRVAAAFVADRAHACTARLKAWLIKASAAPAAAAAGATEDGSRGPTPVAGEWTSQDATLALYQQWHDAVDAELRATVRAAAQYVADASVRNGQLLDPVRESVAQIYGMFRSQVMALFGASGAGPLAAVMMTTEECALWLRDAR
ncbi:hypothetical protein GGF31_007716 [Allomyces arbusculus]|nr:hypothetical protein GGF31_007716 [Allomyces arbusculus]